jgi:hypothetical protein
MNLQFLRSALSVLLLLLSCFAATAQVVKIDSTTNWRKSFKAGLNINQSAFSGNWKGGGVNSFGFNTLMNYKANYKKDKVSWDSEVDLLYGMVNNEGQGVRKTMDRFYLDSKYGYSLSEHWDAFVAVNVLSQFAKGYKYVKDANGVEQGQLISDSFAPIFVTVSLGAEWKPVSYFKMRFSPIAPRVTFLRNNDGRYNTVDPVAPYGVVVGEADRFEWYAFQMTADLDKDIAKNVNLKVRYMMFANYKTLEINKVDHRVDLSLTAKVGRFFNVNLGGIFLYDFDQDHSPQYSQAISMGVLYTFQNFKDK